MNVVPDPRSEHYVAAHERGLALAQKCRRDYFAAAALQGLLSGEYAPGYEWAQVLARNAAQAADALLAELDGAAAAPGCGEERLASFPPAPF